MKNRPAFREPITAARFTSLLSCFAVVAGAVLGIPGAAGAVFTNDTTIGVGATNFDGADIVVSNCTLTVDGLHAFAAVRIANGATLTHSYVPNGVLSGSYAITGEVQVLSYTNTAWLIETGAVASSIQVWDETGTIAYTNGVDFTTVETNGTVGVQPLAGSAIAEGSTNLVDYTVVRLDVPVGLNLAVAGDFWVEPGGRVALAGRGYGPGTGPGAGLPTSSGAGNGGGHGGLGGAGWTNSGPSQFGQVYGVVRQPELPGSGGGPGQNGLPGGAGGGVFNLAAGNLARIDGTIDSRGGAGTALRSGGGAGGSVWISARVLAGAGSILADGGPGEPARGGGGGGGRIALFRQLDLYSGTISAAGGAGWQKGGPGTVYRRLATEHVGHVALDNHGPTGYSLLPQDSEAVDLSLAGGTILGLTTPAVTFTNVWIASNAWLRPANFPLTVLRDCDIAPGGGIVADGDGYASRTGPGAGGYGSYLGIATGGGGGHGGYGAMGGSSLSAFGGSGNGSVTTPTTFGSGGGTTQGQAGAGGGAIRMNVTGMLTVDGLISANGTAGVYSGSGGGAGGSIWITAGTLSGAGAITADGGAGWGGGGGGGGGGGAARSHCNMERNSSSEPFPPGAARGMPGAARAASIPRPPASKMDRCCSITGARRGPTVTGPPAALRISQSPAARDYPGWEALGACWSAPTPWFG